ncbi:hypothetical protein DKX38_030038 [Salix brachista]|uniref:PGG domain-containing protein n=1 Tax=Salix brachista TaxID=2182728 RepID=A0A5N5J470_9ROSI|nr:hypothetical protein DKX38_030038 [Salix brachista]
MKNREEAFNKARESHLVVTALIATVTFAAAFTLPGGYKSDQGTAILVKKVAFIVFVISDAISMVLSISAVFIHFLLAFYQGSLEGTTRADETTVNLFELATLLTMIGMGTMIIAFITGTYAVLEPVLGLAISICLIGFASKSDWGRELLLKEYNFSCEKPTAISLLPNMNPHSRPRNSLRVDLTLSLAGILGEVFGYEYKKDAFFFFDQPRTQLRNTHKESHIVVAALIAMVTFATAFTLPDSGALFLKNVKILEKMENTFRRSRGSFQKSCLTSYGIFVDERIRLVIPRCILYPIA